MSRVVSASFPALGTTATVAVTDAAALHAARDTLAAQLDELDAAASRFRPDSELRMLEGRAGRATAVSPLLLDALEAAVRAARLTAGRVTPTLGRPLVLAGYDRDYECLRPRTDPPRFVAAPAWQGIDLDRPTGRVRIPFGVALDLGATAKAFAADRAATTIAEQTGAGVLVALGGDLRAAGPAPEDGWPVWVDDSHARRTDRAAWIRLPDGGLATSSTTERRWTRGEERLHHILDPASGRPAAPVWRTVSVAAGTCLDANTASTGAVVLGPDAPAWLAERALPARLVSAGGRATVVAGWPEDQATEVAA